MIYEVFVSGLEKHFVPAAREWSDQIFGCLNPWNNAPEGYSFSEGLLLPRSEKYFDSFLVFQG